MAMDRNVPKYTLEQEEAEHTVHEYASKFKDVSYTDPATGKTGFTAMTLDGHFIVAFGFDQEDPSRPGWYYSVAAAEDYAHSARGTGMERAAQAKHLIHKIVSGETWYATHQKEVEEERAARRKHNEEFSEGVIGIHKDADGMYPTES